MAGAGMSRRTGRWLSGWAHTSQSLGDILSTPLATRVMRRPYGAEERALVDKPMEAGALTGPAMAVAVPVARWEPRVELRRAAIATADVGGVLGLTLTAIWKPRALVGDPTPAGAMSTGVVT